jgi:hypothetical protein
MCIHYDWAGGMKVDFQNKQEDLRFGVLSDSHYHSRSSPSL